jgi:hypothetical protein
MNYAENMPILLVSTIKYKIRQLNILQVQTQTYTKIIAEVWLNSTDI